MRILIRVQTSNRELCKYQYYSSQIPKAAHVSAMCKDLLMALLKHNPADRVTYDEFFAHDFLDLEHAPTKENYEKAAALVYKAVEMDAEKNAKEAFYLYCEALRYFIPILTSKIVPKSL